MTYCDNITFWQEISAFVTSNTNSAIGTFLDLTALFCIVSKRDRDDSLYSIHAYKV